MKKSAKILIVAGLLLVNTSKANESIFLKKEHNLKELMAIPSVTSVYEIKQNDSFKRIPKFEAVEPQESSKKEETIENYSNSIDKKYKEFKYPDELPQILKHAKNIGVEPELLMAIRVAENGKDSLAYGVLSNGKRYDNDKGYTLEDKFYPYTNEKEKQLYWAASTVKKNIERFEANPKDYKDFISFLASKYCPIGVWSDPNGLNNNWEKNVRFFYEKFKN